MIGDMNNYPDCYKHFGEAMSKCGVEDPGVMAGFAELHKSAVADGELSAKVKELIALAIGISVRCDGCIATHVHDALHVGATRQEIVETVGVTVLMGGGPALVYGCQALQALDEFESVGGR